MILRAIEYRDVIDTFCAQDREFRNFLLSDDEWTCIDDIGKMLYAFDICTKISSGSSYVTAYEMIPLFQFCCLCLQKSIADNSNTYLLRTALSSALVKLQNYYDCVSPIVPISMVLDPRKKMKHFNLLNWEVEWIDTVENQMQDVYKFYQEPFSNQSSANIDSNHRPFKKTRYDDIFVEFKASISISRTSKSELERYLSSELADESINPLLWWKANSSIYPTLSRMARDFLAVEATSVPCEEIFSGGVDLITPDRCSLNPDTIRMAMCLKNWKF